MEKMQKIKRKKIEIEDKLIHFWLMADLIASDREKVSWIVGGPGTNLQHIKKGSLKFAAKVWWTLVRYRLCSISRDNILIPNCASLITSIMAGYELDVAQLIVREIRDQGWK